MHIIGIGASAGGLKALRRLLADISPSAPAAYVVIQHLPANEKSDLTELLQAYTELSVHTLHEDTVPEPGKVYVMTGDKNVVYRHHRLHLEPRPSPTESLNLPVDRFFDSIGREVRTRAVGVILSGTGTDGSLGTRAIKENGGVVLVQDPATAEFPGMIQAVQQEGLADEALSPQQLARTLNEIVQYSSDNTLLSLNEPHNLHHFQRILDHISDFSGNDFHAYRPPTLARRIEKRMMLDSRTDLKGYYQLLLDSEAETEALFNDFLIGVTRFFRNRNVWNYFADKVVPQLYTAVAAAPPENPIRVWVPACSSGEEAYTVAILLQEHRRLHGVERAFKIFATDVDQEAIRKGAGGVYSAANVKGIPEKFLDRYFEPDGNQYHVKESLRRTVLFATHDCLKDPPFVQLHFISCRNYLIYLRVATQRRLLNTFHFALRDAAYLLLGPSESVGTLRSAFPELHGEFRLFTKRALERSDYRSGPQFSIPAIRPAATDVERGAAAAAPSEDAAFIDVLLDHSIPPSLFVDEHLKVLYTQGGIDDYFRFPKTQDGFDLHHMTDAETADRLQRAVRRALRLQESLLLPGILEHMRDGPRAGVFVRPVMLPRRSRLVVLLQLHHVLDTAPDEWQTVERETYLRSLEQNLAAARDQTERLIESMEAANLELEAGNQELTRSNEELQTANAELQSVNEELYTVNGELQIKNEELTIANNDILNLLSSSKVGTLFLDSDLRIRRFTPDMRELFDLLATDLGRPIAAFSHHLVDFDLQAHCRQVHETLSSFRREVRLENGSHYLLDILPYRTHRDVVRGLVITLFNIDSLVEKRRENVRLASSFNSIFNNSNYTIMFVSPTDRVTRANRPFGKYSVEELVGTPLLSLFDPSTADELRDCLDRAFDKQETTETLLEVPVREDQTATFALKIIPTLPYLEADNESVPNTVLIAEDITDMYTTFLAKQEVLSAQSRIYNKNREQVVIISPSGLIESINYTRYTDISPQDLVGQNIFEMLVEQDRQPFQRTIQDIIRQGKPRRVEFNMQLGARVHRIHNIIAPVFTEDRVTHLAIFHQGADQESS